MADHLGKKKAADSAGRWVDALVEQMAGHLGSQSVVLWVRKWAGLLDVKMADGLVVVMVQRMVALSVAYSVAEMA